MNYYLNDRINNFANSDHLYEALQRAVNEDFFATSATIQEIMRTWEYQAGFPLITVKREGSNFTISQKRFLYTDTSNTNLWHVPITYYTASTPDSSNTKAEFWLLPTPNTVLEAPNSLYKVKAENDWIILNTQQVR